jgi:threonine dehydrogenase-like Zn-dependent dehydrogenase
MPQMIDLVEHLVRWDLHPDRMATHTFRLDQAREAYEIFDQGKTGKVAIVWE